LSRALAAAPSGVSFVYEALDRIADESNGDCVLVLHEPLIGRQAFRVRRRPLQGSWAEKVAAEAAPGLYYDNGVLDRELVDGIIGLCSVAVRLDVVGHDAAHDVLTGLLNRRSFDEALGAAVAQSRRYGWPFTLVLLDARGVRGAGEQLGQVVGDDALRALGAGLRAGMRAGDVVARVSSDAFGLILPNSAPELLPRLVDRLAGAINAAVPGTTAELSIGVGRSPVDATDPDELYRIAEERLHESKVAG
jgi:diguanylate cyclase (GGDEF)-like protein